MRKASISTLFFTLSCLIKPFAQTTTNCLEVESILVASCADNTQTDEGKNEMVRFLVGPNSINIHNIDIDWATTSLSFTGWVQNTITASRTTAINASITACGYVIEPLSGIIPANKRGIIITSYNMDPLANSFANLTDTLYILYQNSNTGTGHFGNHDANGSRTFRLKYPGCPNESVTYQRNLLSNQQGASVAFTQNGNATYYNNGCMAPITPFSVDAGANPPAACPGNTVSLSGTASSGTNTVQWSGGTGTFSTANSTTTSYTLGSGDTAPFWLYLTATGTCSNTATDSVLISIAPGGTISISASGPLSICNGESLTLTASGGTSYQWTGGPSTAQYTVNSPGTYTVTGTSSCGNTQASVTVTASTQASISINQNDIAMCQGNINLPVTVSTSSGNVTWNTGQTGTSITVTNTGTYIATVTGTCGTASDTLTISPLPQPSSNIDVPNPSSICVGQTFELKGNGNGILTWSTGATGSTTLVDQPGTYWLVTQTGCGFDTAFVTLLSTPINASFSATPTNGSVPLTVTFSNTSTNSDTYTWDISGNTDTNHTPSPQTFNQPGTYTVILTTTNAQGCTDTASVTIIVSEEMTVEIPNIFTPNDDGANDTYSIKTSGIADLTTHIYNRWGQIVYKWNGINGFWDGTTLLGAKASNGVYYCTIEATDSAGNTHTYKTTLTLVN